MTSKRNDKKGITHAEIMQDFDIPSFTKETEPKEKTETEQPIKREKTVVSEKRKKIKLSEPENIYPFLYDDVKDKSNNAVYLSGEAHNSIKKLAFILDLDIRQLATNIINQFFIDEADNLGKIYKDKMKF